MSGTEIVLVSMPWSSCKRPNLGLSTLAGSLAAQAISCEVYYPCIDFAGNIGVEAYEALADTPGLYGASEHIFALRLFEEDALDSKAFLRRYELTTGENPFVELSRRFIDRFIEDTTTRILAKKPQVVGFGCTFNQTMASIAVARRLKQQQPELTVILGGSSVHGAMGRAIARAFADDVDHVFLGEADHSLVDFMQSRRTSPKPSGVPGMTVGGHPTASPDLPVDMEALAMPDYSGFFDQIAALGMPSDFVEGIPFESSRGCWWGQKNHCTFCGLNSESMAYRRKSDARIASEVASLSARYRTSRLVAADNILPSNAWKGMLQRIQDTRVDLQLFYEIKANLGRDQVAELRAAGVCAVQPGIESFSTPVLKLMRKGLTALQNIKFLRLCQEFGVAPSYNILVGFPGEAEADYTNMARLMAQVTHLPPPSGPASLVQIHRFSPFHEQSANFGFVDVRPAAHYRHLIPPSVLAPDEYAYYFEYSAPADVRANLALANAVVERWLLATERMAARLCPGFVEITSSTESAQSLGVLESAIIVAADEVRSIRQLVHQVETISSVASDEVEGTIREMVARRWLAEDDGSVVSVVPYAVPHSAAHLTEWLRQWLPGMVPLARRNVIPQVV